MVNYPPTQINLPVSNDAKPETKRYEKGGKRPPEKPVTAGASNSLKTEGHRASNPSCCHHQYVDRTAQYLGITLQDGIVSVEICTHCFNMRTRYTDAVAKKMGIEQR